MGWRLQKDNYGLEATNKIISVYFYTKNSSTHHTCNYQSLGTRVNSGYFGQWVNSDIRLQTVKIKMRRLLRAVSSGFSLFA